MTWASVGAMVAAGLLVWSARVERGPAPVSSQPEPARAAAAPPAVAPEVTDAARAPAAEVDPESDPSEGMFDATAIAWSNVDLDAVRDALPDNGYWERSVPTTDPEVLRQREDERAYWEEQYGKVLSNTASEEEVRAYYDHRQRIATDAVEFAGHLLDRYGAELPERDVGLLELARRLNLARLEELPRDLNDALARRDAHERAREEWLAQQERFDGDAPGEPEGD